MAVKSTCPPTILWLAILLTSSTMQYANSTESESSDVRCEIRTVRDDHGGKVEAIIQARGSVSGSYEFNIRKRTNGEVTSRSGDFQIDSASPAEINKASIPLEPKEAYDATLKVKWPNGASSCSASVG